LVDQKSDRRASLYAYLSERTGSPPGAAAREPSKLARGQLVTHKYVIELRANARQPRFLFVSEGGFANPEVK